MKRSISLTRREALVVTAHSASAFSRFATAAEKQSTRTVPPVPGKLAIAWRRREKDDDGFRAIEETVE